MLHLPLHYHPLLYQEPRDAQNQRKQSTSGSSKCLSYCCIIRFAALQLNLMREDEAMIEQLCSRFDKKPRKCRKINDSNIGYAERIVCINDGTFYYYPKIQEFQDLDFDKLQYVVPKAGVKLDDILQLKFPPRKENQRNYFSISLPKNRILKFTKTLKEIIVDEEAQGEQEWVFYFDYDIVVLPTRERKIREAQARDAEAKRLRTLQLTKLKQQEQKQKIEKINEEITSLSQAEQLRSGGAQNEDYLRKRQQMTQLEDTKRRIAETDELFFHYTYRKLRSPLSSQPTAELELVLLEQIGKFRQRAQQTVQEFVDELSFTPIKFKNGVTFVKNNLKLKFGEKNLNQEFNGNYFIANALFELRHSFKAEIRVPLKALVKYKGFKVLVSAMTPLDALPQQEFDDSIVHGNSSDNWKIDFMLIQNLAAILDKLHLKPYFCQVHYQKVQIHLGSNLKILKTQQNPYATIKNLQPQSFPEDSHYRIFYFYDVDEVFPIDLDINNNIKQENVRLRPEYIAKFVERHSSITHLSAGSLSYAFEDEEGEKEDINVVKASQMLKLQEIVRFVNGLDNLDIVIDDSEELSRAMKSNGINLRYLGLVIKLTQLPYIRVMFEVEAIARVIRSLYREHQAEFVNQKFRKEPGVSSLVSQAFNSRINAGMRRIRLKQLKQHEEKYSRQNACDFLNLIFGMSEDFAPFWSIVSHKVKEKYEFQIRDPQDYPHGYLLKTLLYHCGIELTLTDKIPLFLSNQPFQFDDILGFCIRTKVYDFPVMTLHKLTSLESVEGAEATLNRLQLSLQIKRALGQNQSAVLVQLSRLSSKVGAPSNVYSLESFYYYLYHATADNFETAHRIATTILPSSHPCLMELYLQYGKLKELDPITLKRAAEIHSMRNLGISHWRTSQILAHFNQADYIAHLIKAEPGVEHRNKTELYLAIVVELTKYGKLVESLNYVERAVKAFDGLTSLNETQQHNYFEILLKGMENNYLMRTIEELLKLSEVFYNALTRYKVPYTDKWYELLLYYTFKSFLENSKRKYYLFKLVLIFKEEVSQPASPDKKRALLEEFGARWRQSRNHINHLKQMLIKLQFGFTEINFLPNFFSQFYEHMQRFRNEDFKDGLKEYRELFYMFGFTYFQDALLENVYSFEKQRTLSS